MDCGSRSYKLPEVPRYGDPALTSSIMYLDVILIIVTIIVIIIVIDIISIIYALISSAVSSLGCSHKH